MLDRIEDYQRTLRGHSGPLMDFIEWRPTPDRNVEVLNDTADLYRYFDCTEEAEFLYGCVAQTVDHDLPQEIDFLRRQDEAQRRIKEFVEMPDRLVQDLIMFIRQNGGTLPKKRREKEFAKLTGEEVFEITGIRNVVEHFAAGQRVKVRAKAKGKDPVEFDALVRIDTPQEALYYANGGILQYVLRQLLAAKPSAQTVGV